MRRLVFVACLLAVAGLLALGAIWAAPAIEDDISDQIDAALSAADLDRVAYEVDGRTVAISGRVPATVSSATTLALIAEIDGIRQVRDDGLVVDRVATLPPDPSIVIEIGEGVAEVSGSVADQAQLSALVSATQELAPTIVSRADISTEPLDDSERAHIDALIGFVTALGDDLRAGRLVLAAGQLTLTATVDDDARSRVEDTLRATGIAGSISFDTPADPP